MKRYHHAEDGERLFIPARMVKIACCDCGLVHLFKFRRSGRGLAMRAWRDPRATGGKRAARKRAGK